MIRVGSKVIVYAGTNYGRIHDVVAVEGRSLHCRCRGNIVVVHVCDVELVEAA